VGLVLVQVKVQQTPVYNFIAFSGTVYESNSFGSHIDTVLGPVPF
jgi:hypothetical protein